MKAQKRGNLMLKTRRCELSTKMAGTSVEEETQNVLKNISRHLNCLSEENRNTRKRALEGIKKETIAKNPLLSSAVLEGVFQELLKPLLKILSDPVEKCRELSIGTLTECLKQLPGPENYLPYIIPVLVQRLGQQDIVETSEELRLMLIELFSSIVESTKKAMAPYLDDAIKILQRTLLDPYSEVRKQSCRCACSLAKSIPQHFHMQSESLIKPLLQTVSHQHSRVRVEVVKAIGDVIQYGNGKSVDDVVSHLAQRLFDQSPTVRAAVTQVVGTWLLDLPDRYSFHHKLIPLLLTSITDDIPDIQRQAADLWHDVGLKYESENENDLKDKQDFVRPDPDHFPADVERPNLGCRTLVYRNFSRIASGLVKDITDWVVATRIKSAQLMYTLLLNEEENVTQHLEKVLGGLYKACTDEEEEVVKYVIKSAELLGYFVSPEIWCKMLLNTVKSSQSFGPMMMLAGIVRGSQGSSLKAHLAEITAVLSDPDVCRLADSALQREVLVCVEALIQTCGADCKEVSLQLFTVLISVLALLRQETLQEKIDELLNRLSVVQNYSSRQQLYEVHTKQVIESLQDSYAMWTQHSVERLLFDTLLLKSGAVVGEILEDIMPMMVANLKPDKDPEVRLKFFSLLSRLMMNCAATLDSQQRFGDFAVTVVRDMVIPNCVWTAGRVAGAIRTTAVSCLWALLQSGVLSQDKLLEVMEELMTQLRSCLEDDNKSTRLVTCRAIMHIFRTVGSSLDRDRLHNMYPELLKRLDDASDDIRVATCKTFVAYFDCFGEEYEASLYRAHTEAIYKGLLVHLDDPDAKIQEAVLEVLQRAASIDPAMLMKELEVVKAKHRTAKYCDALAKHISTLSKHS